MPIDGKGKFQMSGLRPGSDGKLPVGRANEKTMGKLREPKPNDMNDQGDIKVHEIHEHPDGHFETHMHDGTHETHPDHLHMTTHIAHQIEPESKHYHSSHDGFGHQSHGMTEAGEHDGTHDHANIEELKGNMDQFLGEEAKEGQHEYGGGEKEETPLGGM